MATEHERKLHKIATQTSYELQMDRKRRKGHIARQKEIDEAKAFAACEFWCDACRLDYAAVGFKCVTRLYDTPVATYRSSCPKCGDVCARRITDRLTDPYWFLSEKVMLDRFKTSADTVQPGQWGFSTLYPHIFDSFIEGQIEKEDAVWQEEFDPSTRLSRSKAMKRKLHELDYRNR